MKKLITSFTCALFLILGAVQVNAAILETWNFDVSIDSFEKDGQKLNSVSWLSGNHQSTLSIYPNSTTSIFNNKLDLFGFFSITSPGESTYTQIGSTNFLGQTTIQSTETNTSTSPYFIANLIFKFQGNDPNGNASFGGTVTIPLMSYYDAASDKSYVYFSAHDTSLTGSSTALLDSGGKLGLNGMFLFQDGSPIEGYEEAYLTQYRHWEMSVSQETPAPTPEPATLLLTGLGLAGLICVKRRRKNA